MTTKAGAVMEKPVSTSTCRHHWLIEPPDGPISKGVCKVCGEVKVFDNVLEDLLSKRDSVATFEPDNLPAGNDEDTEDDA